MAKNFPLKHCSIIPRHPYAAQNRERSIVEGDTDPRYNFTGKERDVETQYDYGVYPAEGRSRPKSGSARYYDSRIGRWLSVDPKDTCFGEISPFVYCMNSPVCFIDLFGDSARVWLDKRDRNNYKITFVNYGDGKYKDEKGNLVNDKPEPKTWEVGTAVTKGHTEIEADKNGKIADDLTPKAIKKNLRYGPGDWTYIDTGRDDRKDIHGGGFTLGDPEAYADYQRLTPTWGCQRMHNAEIRQLSKMIREYKRTHPGEKVPEYEKR